MDSSFLAFRWDEMCCDEMCVGSVGFLRILFLEKFELKIEMNGGDYLLAFVHNFLLAAHLYGCQFLHRLLIVAKTFGYFLIECVH